MGTFKFLNKQYDFLRCDSYMLTLIPSFNFSQIANRKRKCSWLKLRAGVQLCLGGEERPAQVFMREL